MSRSKHRIQAFLLLLLGAGLASPAMAGSLKWVPSDPNAPRPGPAQPVAPPPMTPLPGSGPISTDATDTAGPGIERSGDYLSRMDGDGNGKVSLLEYQDWLTYAFDRMDANRDGVLSPAEQPGGRAAALTRDAHRARVAETFRRQDSNQDGSLDPRELAAPPQRPVR